MIIRLPKGYTHRPATTDDADQATSLYNELAESILGRRPNTSEQTLRMWKHPKFKLSTDSRLVFAPDGQLIGYAQVRDVKDPPVDVFGWQCIHPTFDDAKWLWNDLLSWMESEARRVIAKAPGDARIALVNGTSEQDPCTQQKLEDHGFDHSRTFHRMQIDFVKPASEVSPPEGIRFRNVVPGEDDIALVTAYQEAFANHYGILEQPFEVELQEWRDLMQDDDFDPSLWFLATDTTRDDAIAGLCVCQKEARGDSERGQINDVGVRPTWRQRGIGQALLLLAFSRLANHGIKGAVLTVDTQNKTGAPALYKRVGMRSVQANLTYVKELRPGINLVPQ
jgi:mycothiol synthase